MGPGPCALTPISAGPTRGPGPSAHWAQQGQRAGTAAPEGSAITFPTASGVESREWWLLEAGAPPLGALPRPFGGSHCRGSPPLTFDTTLSLRSSSPAPLHGYTCSHSLLRSAGRKLTERRFRRYNFNSKSDGLLLGLGPAHSRCQPVLPLQANRGTTSIPPPFPA